VPALLYGLDVCPLNNSDTNSLDFVANQFFIKLFCTSGIDIIRFCFLVVIATMCLVNKDVYIDIVYECQLMT